MARRSAGRTRTGAALLALGAFVAVLLPMIATAAPPPTATRIDISSIVTPGVTLPETPGTPAVYVVKATDFSVGVAFSDGTTPLPLSYNKPTDLWLKVLTGPDAGTMWQTTAPAGSTSATFTGLQFPDAGSGAVLQVSSVGSSSQPAITSPPSAPFTVLVSSGSASKDAALTSITSGGTAANPCAPTPNDPVCADLQPGGVATADGLLSLSPCEGASCKGQGVQVLIALKPAADIRQTPATLVFKCDKTLCPGGGIRKYQLEVTLVPGGPAVIAPGCPRKGVVGPDQKFCVDYVQSTRDNAGDTLLYLLFVEDAKVRFP